MISLGSMGLVWILEDLRVNSMTIRDHPKERFLACSGTRRDNANVACPRPTDDLGGHPKSRARPTVMHAQVLSNTRTRPHRVQGAIAGEDSKAKQETCKLDSHYTEKTESSEARIQDKPCNRLHRSQEPCRSFFDQARLEPARVIHCEYPETRST